MATSAAPEELLRAPADRVGTQFSRAKAAIANAITIKHGRGRTASTAEREMSFLFPSRRRTGSSAQPQGQTRSRAVSRAKPPPPREPPSDRATSLSHRSSLEPSTSPLRVPPAPAPSFESLASEGVDTITSTLAPSLQHFASDGADESVDEEEYNRLSTIQGPKVRINRSGTAGSARPTEDLIEDSAVEQYDRTSEVETAL